MHNASPVRLLWLLCFTAAMSHSCLAAGDPFSAGDDNVTIGQLEAIQARTRKKPMLLARPCRVDPQDGFGPSNRHGLRDS